MNAARKNFWTAVVAAFICAVLLTVIGALSIRHSNDLISRRPSTYFTDRTGSRALLLVLQRVMPSANTWQRPFSELTSQGNSAQSTLIVLGPEEPLSEADATALDQWISSGGQLILATGTEWRIRKPQKIETPEEFLPTGFLARHSIQLKTEISENDAVSMATTKPLGAGRIILVPNQYAFSNDTLGYTDNAVWIAQASARGNVVLIDEYHHGFGQQREMRTLLLQFAGSPWGFVVMQLALAGIVYILGFKRRFGRPVEALPVERTSPVEAIEALGGLFETARAGALSVKTIHQYLNLHLTSLFGYSVDLLNPAIRNRIADRSSLSLAQLDSYAETVKLALDSESTADADLIRIARNATMISRSFSHGNARQRPGRTAAAG